MEYWKKKYETDLLQCQSDLTDLKVVNATDLKVVNAGSNFSLIELFCYIVLFGSGMLFVGFCVQYVIKKTSKGSVNGDEAVDAEVTENNSVSDDNAYNRSDNPSDKVDEKKPTKENIDLNA